MRVSRSGDTYCHTAEEARKFISENSDGAVNCDTIDPPEGDYKASAEIRTNVDGENVCYVEADTVDQVRAIVIEAGIEIIL